MAETVCAPYKRKSVAVYSAEFNNNLVVLMQPLLLQYESLPCPSVVIICAPGMPCEAGTVFGHVCLPVQKLTRNSPGDEIANVNFLYDDIVHALKMQ